MTLKEPGAGVVGVVDGGPVDGVVTGVVDGVVTGVVDGVVTGVVGGEVQTVFLTKLYVAEKPFTLVLDDPIEPYSKLTLLPTLVTDPGLLDPQYFVVVPSTVKYK